MKKYLIITCIITFLCSTLVGQSDLNIENVDVIKTFEVNLEDATMIKPMIELVEIPKSPHNYNYDLSIVPLDIDYPPPYIRPVSMVQDKPETWNNGYIKAGYGNLKNPFGQFRAGFHAEDYYDISLVGNFTAFDDVAVTDKKYLNGNGEVNLDYKVTQELTANVNLRGGLEEVHFFGFNDEQLSLPIDSARQYVTAGLTLGIDSKIDEINRFGFGASVTYDQMRITQLSAREHNIKTEAHLGYQLGKLSVLKIDGFADLTFLRDGVSDNLHFYGLRPTFQFGSKKINAMVGAKGRYDGSKTHVFPNVLLSYKLINDEIVIEAGANGDLVKYNYLNLRELNPFIDAISNIEFYKYYEVHAGVKGQFGSKIEYHGKIGYRSTENFGLFLNNFDTNSRAFGLVHDNLNMTFINGSIKVALNDLLTIGGNINTNIYNTNIADKPWHMPALELDVYGIVTLLNDKISLRSDLYIRDRVDYLQADNVAAKSNVLYDLSIKLDYMPSPAFGIFAEGQNLLASKYERWHGYYNYGAYVLGGIKVIF